MNNTKDIKIGDRILVRTFWGEQTFHAHVLDIFDGFLGKKYLCRWTVNSDLFGEYKEAGLIGGWRVYGKY